MVIVVLQIAVVVVLIVLVILIALVVLVVNMSVIVAILCIYPWEVEILTSNPCSEVGLFPCQATIR